MMVVRKGDTTAFGGYALRVPDGRCAPRCAGTAAGSVARQCSHGGLLRLTSTRVGILNCAPNTGLYPFMIASSNASLSVVYEIVRANPVLAIPR
jgi:hypothetical protein